MEILYDIRDIVMTQRSEVMSAMTVYRERFLPFQFNGKPPIHDASQQISLLVFQDGADDRWALTGSALQ